jgi:outer membrane immunogenic protein
MRFKHKRGIVMRNYTIVCTAALALSMAGPALAADIPVKAPPLAPVVAPVFSWTGFYIGGNIGGAWLRGGCTDTRFGLTCSSSSNNGVFIAGGQAGFNYQINNFVIGVEGDGDWAGNNGGNNGVGVVVPRVGTIVATANRSGWDSTLAARFGVAFDRVLLYGKAGGAWVGANNITVANLTTGQAITFGGGTKTGWVVGAGLEWAFWQNWTGKIEYDYIGRSGQTFFFPPGTFLAGDTFNTGNRNVQLLKVGVNYLFNWGAPGPFVPGRY